MNLRSQKKRKEFVLLFFLCCCVGSSRAFPTAVPDHQYSHHQHDGRGLSGNWEKAGSDLRDPDCCVVSVSGLDQHLQVLHDQWAVSPADVDLRARITVGTATQDCVRVRRSISVLPDYDNECGLMGGQIDPCSAALRELARGMAGIMKYDPDTTTSVFVRIVCASNYKARDPMYHTDKAPLRGYVTLHGPGTDFLTRTVSSPLEYLALRSFGRLLPSDRKKSLDIRRADKLEFIIMKGDYYYSYRQRQQQQQQHRHNMVIDRTYACMHRSPPANDGTSDDGSRRVIVSFDLDDGSDDREWYEIHKKREWRSGMTQRKSHLVA